MWQNIIVIIIAAAVVIYAIVSVVQILQGKKGCSCDCSCCKHGCNCSDKTFSIDEDKLKQNNLEP
ncbi:MAG: FeoB-associated Cys-rich membrane protein [Bacteroidales bacterium]|jgi:hypothetical protein|nr:FeoB-associated Cys-rich membrane protein [Bacteroidales bacterium]